jgi:hypothetical protein
MKLQIAKLRAKVMSISSLKLRVISGLLFVLSGVSVYFARREVYVYDFPMSRIRSNLISFYYIWLWQLLGLAILLFITALTMLIISFKKSDT